MEVKYLLVAISMTLVPLKYAFADEVSSHSAKPEKEVQDMSDPLAIYTQAGVGVTDKGLNFKVGQAYDTVLKTKLA